MRLSLFGRLDRLIAGTPAAARIGFLGGTAYAHRGLHGNGVVENSRAAFAAAIAAGHGIECDVQLSADDGTFVFHDTTLERLTDKSGAIAQTVGNILDRIRLSGTTETIPRLEEMLALVAGAVPLLIEVKAPEHEAGAICAAVRRALEGYRGPVAVMSFNPEVGRWYARHAPRVVRGLVVSEDGKRGWRGRIERRLSLWRALPDFLAYDVRDLPSVFAAQQRARGLPVLTWTVRSVAAASLADAHADAAIYEKYAA